MSHGRGATPFRDVRQQQPQHRHHRPPIVVTDHDVLSGRGVHIAQHPGNERFRALVHTRFDAEYCDTYSTSEKRAVAEGIIAHMKSLDPPGRFLRRTGRSTNARGLSGPWEELSDREAVKKTCQALRDCNRPDRSGYASGVTIPEDVAAAAQLRSQAGLSNRQLAQQSAEAASKMAHELATLQGKRPYEQTTTAYSDATSRGAVSPSIQSAAECLKKQRMDPIPLPLPAITPATTATMSGIATDEQFASLDAASVYAHEEATATLLDLPQASVTDFAMPIASGSAFAAYETPQMSVATTAASSFHAPKPDVSFEGGQEDCKPAASVFEDDSKPAPGDLTSAASHHHHQSDLSADLAAFQERNKPDPLSGSDLDQLHLAAAAAFASPTSPRSRANSDENALYPSAPPSPLHHAESTLNQGQTFDL